LLFKLALLDLPILKLPILQVRPLSLCIARTICVLSRSSVLRRRFHLPFSGLRRSGFLPIPRLGSRLLGSRLLTGRLSGHGFLLELPLTARLPAPSLTSWGISLILGTARLIGRSSGFAARLAAALPRLRPRAGPPKRGGQNNCRQSDHVLHRTTPPKNLLAS
jgi:hypothetical protein